MYLNTRQEFVSLAVTACLLSFAATVLFAIFLASPNPQVGAQGSSSAETPPPTPTNTATATVFSCGPTSSDNHTRLDDSFDAASLYPKLAPILQMWLDKFDPNFPPGYTYAEIVTTGQFSRIVKLLNEGGYEHVIEGNSIFVFEVPILTLAYWSNFTEVVSILFNEWAGRSRQLDTQISETHESGLGISEDSVQMGTPYTVYAQVVNGVAQAGMKAKHAVQIEG